MSVTDDVSEPCLPKAKQKLGKEYQAPGTILDVAAGQHKAIGRGLSPTITSSRGRHAGAAYYVPSRRTCLVLHELGRLTGLGPAMIAEAVRFRLSTVTLWLDHRTARQSGHILLDLAHAFVPVCRR